MKEIWKDIKGYEGLYQISNYGRVKSMKRYVQGYRKDLRNEMILKAENHNGYKKIILTKDRYRKKFFVHRLVAMAFIPNPNNYPIINHKDENRSNNCVENLEWCTHEYNLNYGNRNKKLSELMPKVLHSKAVLQIDKNTGQIINEFSSCREAARQIGKRNASSSICDCCLQKKYRNSAYGYIWRYK